MACTEAEAETVSVGEVAAMSDVELAQFMEKHRQANGNYDLPVDGWDKLSRDERDRLAERLKAQRQTLAGSPTTCSQPLDLDDLNTRLGQVSPNRSFSLRPTPQAFERSESATPPFDLEADMMQPEIEAFHALVDGGGRPSYPIDLIRDVFRHPDNHAETLRPWQQSLTQVRAESIFQTQLQRWRDFRKWQNDNRGREDDDGGFLSYVEQQKHSIQSKSNKLVEWQKYVIPRESRKEAAAKEKEAAAKRLAEIETDPSCLKSKWEDIQWERERQRSHCRERGCRGFRDYAEAVKRRLARHDFTQPFALNENPGKQDKLTTWIEYLNYEYWWLDKYAGDIERLEPEHDRLWQELVDKKILRPHETKEFVRTMASPMERQNEEDMAWKAVERTESEAKGIFTLTQKDPKRLQIPEARRISMMKASAEKLLAVKRRFEQIESRNHQIGEFVRGTFDYAEAKRDAARHRVLVQWVLEQVPLIEAEMNWSKVNRRPGSQGKRTKRKLTTDEEPPERQISKKPKFDSQPSPITCNDARAPSKASSTQQEPRIVLTQEPVQGPRRSARIAARQDASRTALEPDMSPLRTRLRSKAKHSQPPRFHSSIGDRKAHTSSRRGIAKPTRRSQRHR